jgi:hypothetical protein
LVIIKKSSGKSINQTEYKKCIHLANISKKPHRSGV